MRPLLALLFAALLSQAAAAWVPAGTIEPGAYVLDPARANLTSRVRWFGLSQHVVRFQRVSGGFTYDPARPARTRLTIHVDPRSITGADTVSGRQMLQMLEPDRYPRITFTSRDLEPGADNAALIGDLTMHGVTRPVSLQISYKSPSSAAASPGRIAFSGEGRIRRSEFGMAALRNVVSDRVELRFEVEFTRQ
jgi:polyisoprenoid-binding protein YceI